MRSPWFAATMLAIESNGVIALRLMKIARGGPASRSEQVLMVQEKTSALLEAGTIMMARGSFDTVVARYREHVLSNSDRLLSKPSSVMST